MLLSLSAAQVGPDATDLLRRAVGESCTRKSAPIPRWDERLAAAALAAARRPSGLWPPAELQAHVEALGVGDPAPSGFLVEGPSAEVVARVVADKLPALLEPATHYGAALAPLETGVRAVIIRSRRRAVVSGLVTAIEPGHTVKLQGQLAADLRAPALYVEQPDGRVVTLPLQSAGTGFQAELMLRSPGSYRIELMARGARGPEVAWLSTVQVGRPSALVTSAAATPVRPEDPVAEALQVFDAINRDRLGIGVPTLAFDAKLAAVARAYSRELGELHLLAHVSPRSGDLPSRLRQAHYAYSRAGENLAEGVDSLQAHALAAQSPAHRRNMLDPTFDRCGVGVTEVHTPGRPTMVIVTELFAGG